MRTMNPFLRTAAHAGFLSAQGAQHEGGRDDSAFGTTKAACQKPLHGRITPSGHASAAYFAMSAAILFANSTGFSGMMPSMISACE